MAAAQQAVGADATAAALDDEAAKQVYWWCHLSEDELLALDQLRAALAALTTASGGDAGDAASTTAAAARAVAALPASMKTDLALLRFLKARSFDPQRALEMYSSMAVWRLNERPGSDDHEDDGNARPSSSAAAAEKRAFKRHYPHFLHKTDRYGRPVSYRLLGRADVDALVRELGTTRRFLRLHLATNEAFRERVLPACSRAAGRQVLSGVQVLDLAGFSVSRHFTPCVRAVFPVLNAVDSANFPEHLGTMVIVNAPALFRSVWAAVRPWLNARTLNKISVVGGGEAAREALATLIPPERLPVAYGGLSACDGVEDVGPWTGDGVEGEEGMMVGADDGGKEGRDRRDGRGAADREKDGGRRHHHRGVVSLMADAGGQEDERLSGGGAADGESRSGGGSSWGGASQRSSQSGGGVARLLMRGGSGEKQDELFPHASGDGQVRLTVTSAVCRKHTGGGGNHSSTVDRAGALSPTPYHAFVTPRQSWTGDEGEGGEGGEREEDEDGGLVADDLVAAAAAAAAAKLAVPVGPPNSKGLRALVASVRSRRMLMMMRRQRPLSHPHAE